MADEKTGADSIRFFLTGASSHSGAQTDPNLSLGNHQSSTELAGMVATVTSPISNITILHAAPANGTGAGSLIATGANTLTWTPPGGTVGVATTIANGETKIVEAGNNEEYKYLRVSRTSATALSGTATVTLALPKNNGVAFDDVSSAERTAGDTEYRCVCMENVASDDVATILVATKEMGTAQVTDVAQLPSSGAGTIETSGSFSTWPAAGFALVSNGTSDALAEAIYYTSRTDTVLTVGASGRAQMGTAARAGAAGHTAYAIPAVSLALDAPTSQPSGTFEDETGTGEGTSPGFTFRPALHALTGTFAPLSVGTLQTTEIYGVWLKRDVVALATKGSGFSNPLDTRFDAP